MYRIFIFLPSLLLLGFVACTDKTPKPPEAIGGDKDTHGCLPAAGYQWSVLKNDCIRLFESGIRLDAQAAGLDKTVSAFIIFKSDDDDAQVELFLPTGAGSVLLNRAPDNGAGLWKSDTLSLSQWKGMYTLEGKSGVLLYQGMAASAAAETDISGLIPGKWQSVDDPKSSMEISAATLVNYYAGKKVDTRVFAFSADCSGNACAGGAGNMGCFTSAGKFDIECYSVVRISDTEMEVSLVGATGKTLKYKKLK